MASLAGSRGRRGKGGPYKVLAKLDENAAALLQDFEGPLRAPLVAGLQYVLLLFLVVELIFLI